jgi:hypothetical protein
MKHKHYDIIVAWANGAKIQKRLAWGGWVDCNNPPWDCNEEYRINPNPVACPRCGKVHTCDPVDPDKILKEQAKKIADEIDTAVLSHLKTPRQISQERIYYEREAEYCREEMEAFIQSPSDENRLRVLLKRRRFLESGGEW